MYWFVALAVTVIVITLAWRGLGARTDESAPVRRPLPPRPPTRSVAPDDDPDFLNEIDRKLRGEDKNGSAG